MNMGPARRTLSVAGLDALAAARGVEPVKPETCSRGVRKLTCPDPDGNEIVPSGMR